MSILEKAGFNTSLRGVYDRLRAVPILGAGLGLMANRLYPRGSRVWMTVQGGLGRGLWMHLDPRFEVCYCAGEYENGVQNFLAEQLRSGDTFYEVGGHIGFISLIAARLVGAEGEIVVFEADPENAARIQEHFRKNSVGQARVIPQAVWSKSGSLQFERASVASSRNTGAVRENPDPVRGSESIEVEAVALDDYLQGRRPPSLVKIDVEGAELHVLQGAERLLTKHKPVLLCEVHSPEIAVQVESLLIKNGYTLQWLAGGTQFPRHLVARPDSGV